MNTWILRVCGIVLAFTLFYSGWEGYQKDAAFADHGQRAVIDPVTEYEQTVTTTKKLGITVGQSTRNAAYISFRTAAGQRMRVYMNLPDTVLAASAQQAVMVEYLPEDPTIARYAGNSSGYVRALLFGLAALGLTVVFWKKM